MTRTAPKTTFVRLRSKTTGEWFVHPDLRGRMVADAAETSLTELAVRILCEQMKIKYTPNPRKSQPSADSDVLHFSIPPKVEKAVRVAAARHGHTTSDEVREILSAHYGLPVPPKVKQVRAPRRAAAAAA